MNRPKMILFDAGKTLIDYLPKTEDNGTLCLSTIDATEKLMQYVVSNPNRYDAATIDRVNNEVFEAYDPCRKAFYEINNQTILKMIFDLLNIELSISFAEVERIIWERKHLQSIGGLRRIFYPIRRFGRRFQPPLPPDGARSQGDRSPAGVAGRKGPPCDFQ